MAGVKFCQSVLPEATACKKSQIYCLADKPSSRQVSIIVWKIADALNALMAIPNLIAVLLLSKQIVKETKYYLHENRLDERDPELK